MPNTIKDSQKNNIPISATQPIVREKNRWLMMFYDTILYLLCGIAVFVLHPSMPDMPPVSTVVFHLSVGYVLIFGMRLLMKCYKYIWRYGSIFAFTRELIAGTVGVGALVLLSRVLKQPVSFVTVAVFGTAYILLSILVRVFYCHMYRFAEKKTGLSKLVRKLLMSAAFVDFNSKQPGALLHLVLESEKGTSGPINELQNIVDRFAIRGQVTAITQINKGYINRTYRVETISDRGNVHKYTLQRINTNVFPDVDALMENFKFTTSRLYGRLKLPGKNDRGVVQMVRPTKDGCAYLRDDSGCWRMLTYFDGVYSVDIPHNPEMFYQAGRAFGSFMTEMSGVDVDEIKVVIPDFHNTRSRYEDLEKAIALDPKGRVKDVQKEIRFVRDRTEWLGIISDALASGEIPLRICHNDCNLNNILFDNETDMPVAIIDLDTVMPSSPLYDYGDSMRIGTNTATDDEKDLSKVSCDLNLYENYARGYLEVSGSVLTRRELELLPYAALIITMEDGIRFLMDHINGDTYYNIYYPGQNLDRSRTQLKLVEDMEKKFGKIKGILRQIYAEQGLEANLD